MCVPNITSKIITKRKNSIENVIHQIKYYCASVCMSIQKMLCLIKNNHIRIRTRRKYYNFIRRIKYIEYSWKQLQYHCLLKIWTLNHLDVEFDEIKKNYKPGIYSPIKEHLK